ncbi:ribonuclease T2 family protein [Pseudosulfitobacter pseudonitzschiae]|uniref:ribonuclease T2 family protein n=1 Tax=Pseudosulfitobacter pseudonitzschiae TaxID=1402135 RepID=UPI001AF17F7F|nr:ribonuclease T2 [Pseudosulfitobacter pseudonitzschiae]MBM1816499.1 ribonuclease T2 [Pseudosulfitobacter pseudonitzschiae]MBM1833097.1 ribonuclease T2 [Pseudosulfitobacter pseudonitzschiae]MBM1837965.1 ribonuclease T2 [Pseudosulfitobacter pseudonitzschiae]MBM1843226.1 ribonuclease T2 [Pseudosulfitobacter pseudonitzschiae]MBM1848092.1 ribonuclease T2 [Pseudosulfitobacter pseudonitzschiae]
MRAALIWLCMALPVWAENDRAGVFDYYVMSLSWSPNWCLREGDARRSPQCDDSQDHGWILHGLWPQYHRGFPSYCNTAERPPSRGMTAQMSDIMGTSGLAWHQWKKHGTCTGLSAADYYALSREAYALVVRPPVFRKITKRMKLPASVVEEAFLQANPGFERDGITITCQDGMIEEARICLSRDLKPVPCGQDVVRDCRMKDAIFDPVR